MNTKEVMELAIELAGLDEVPEDSGIMVEGDNIKKIFAGIDMGTAEIMLAKQLGADLVISHHPMAGSPRINLHQVMENQIDRMMEAGVPINKAQKALREKKEEVERALHVTNYDRAVSAAKLLGMPYMNIHTPADLIAQRTVQEYVDRCLGDKPKTRLKELVDCLKEISEYKKTPAGPVIRVAGGTGGGVNVYKAYFEAGIGTLVVMHAKEDVIKAVKEQNTGNIVVAGHMASDSIGMNGILTKLESRNVDVIRMAGIIDPDIPLCLCALTLHMIYFHITIFRSIHDTNWYMRAARIARMITLVITRSSLNTCPPYIIRYPSPALDTRNSPTITPTQARPTFIFIAETMVDMLAGSITFCRICSFVAPKV